MGQEIKMPVPLEHDIDFQHAVATARASVPVQKRMVKPEYWSDYIVVQRTGSGNFDNRFAVYKESAWSEPSQTPLLLWSPPIGNKVARVTLDGSVEISRVTSTGG